MARAPFPPGSHRSGPPIGGGQGARSLLRAHPTYPEWLRRIPDPPPVLTVRGDPAVLCRPSIAVVGSRAATAYGVRIARGLARDLAAQGFVVVSGLALGIDAAAHQGALEAGGATVAVFASGLDRVHPARHRRLAERIAAAGGALVSEFPPGTPPLRRHFPRRNRLISGLSRAVVVVEARLRSGSLITAHHALEQGREVLAVPGPVDAPTSAGTNDLLRHGAAPAIDADDVRRVLGLPPPSAGRGPSAGVPPGPGGLAGRLLEALRREPASADELARRTGRSPGDLALPLLELELGGHIETGRDGRLRAAPGRG